MLLFKCKATIEELQGELEQTQKLKVSLEEKVNRLEKENMEKSDMISQEKFMKEKIERILSFLRFLRFFLFFRGIEGK